jgi:hypothetical protein
MYGGPLGPTAMARLRKGSGLREADLLARAKALRASVDPLLPKLTDDCPRDRFDRLRAELEEVRGAAEDERRLARLSRWGDPIPRAYAGLLKFALDPSTPAVVAFPTAHGDVSYAPLAATDGEAEVAVQRSEEPDRLLFGYLDWARKGFHFYATRRSLWCTGRSSRPPAEFVAEHLAELPYRLIEEPTEHLYRCPHLANGEPRPYLEVGWPGAGLTFRVCRRCAKDDRHLLASVSEGAATPDPEGEYPVTAELNVACRGGEACVHRSLPAVPRALLKRYTLGRLADAQLLDGYLDELRPRIEKAGGRTLVAGGVCYGSDTAAFVEALGPSPVERRALLAVVGAIDGAFEVDEPSASRALERLWGEHAEEIVGVIVPDPAQARRLVDEARGAPGRVAEILKRLQRRSEEREMLETLPRYDRLVPEAAWTDRVARAYRVGGEAGAERTALQTLPREGKERGLGYGFLLALGRAGAHGWQFTPTEKEFGQALQPRIAELLHAPPERYHACLDALLRAAGVADWGTVGAAHPPAGAEG